MQLNLLMRERSFTNWPNTEGTVSDGRHEDRRRGTRTEHGRISQTSSCLRGHLAVLKLHDAAEALPSVLDKTTAEELSTTAASDRLLSIEVEATEARRVTGRLRFACLPTPASLKEFDYTSGVDRK